jgi:hypothetical protein
MAQKQRARFKRAGTVTNTWPRHYAADILALPTREERQAALRRVPKRWCSLVEAHVRIAWQRPKIREESDDGQ